MQCTTRGRSTRVGSFVLLEGDVAQPRRNAKLQVGEKFGAALAEIMGARCSTLNAMPVPQRLNASHPTLTTHVSVATLHPCPPATLGVGTRPMHGL